jgi:hypothetical protein
MSAAAIEAHLKQANRWVSAAELARLFDVHERDLRCTHDKPGLCSNFAISGTHGYKHFTHATDEEFDHFVARLRAHSRTQNDRANHLVAARNAHLNQTDPPAPVGIITFDPAGQGLLIS